MRSLDFRHRSTKRDIITLAVCAILIGAIFVPLQNVSAVTIDLENKTIRTGGNTGIDLKVTAQNPSTINFTRVINSETIADGEIRVTVDHGAVLATFHFDGTTITPDASNTITSVTFGGITHGASAPTNTFGSGPYYGYGFGIDSGTPGNVKIGDGSTVTGISSTANGEDTTGNYKIVFNPSKLTTGTHHIQVDVLRTSSDTKFFSTGDQTFTVSSAVSSSIKLNPIGGPTGSMVDVMGSGFLAGSTLTVTFQGTGTVATTTVNGAGNFTTMFTVPSVSSGGYTVTASDGTNSAHALFAVSTSVTLDKTSGLVGSTIKVSGNGYASKSNLHFFFNGTDVTPSGHPQSTKDGAFNNVQITVPASGPGLATITVRDSVGTPNSASAPFTVLASSITLNPTSGGSASSIKVSGVGFAKSSTLHITFNGTDVTPSTHPKSTGTGTFNNVAITAPASGPGHATITVTDSAGTPTSASATFTVVSSTVSLDKSSGVPGSTIKISGTNFVPKSSLHFFFNGTDVTPVSHPQSTKDGAFNNVMITVPASGPGLATITVRDSASPVTSGSATFTVLSASISLDKSSGVSGSTIKVSGVGYASKSNLHFFFNGTDVTPSGHPQSGKDGTFTNISITAPATGTGLATITVRDSAGTPTSASATFTVVPASISLNPTSGGSASSIKVSGVGFAKSSTLTITFNGTNVTPVSHPKSGADGKFTNISINAPASVSGTATITVTDSAGTPTSASATFTVVPASIGLDKTSGVPASTIKVTGSHFAPNSSLHFFFNGTDVTPVSHPKSGATGSFSNVAINAPATVPGTATITVTDSASPATSASTTFTVTPTTITLSPTTGPLGTAIKITGAGFAKSSRLTITFNGTDITPSGHPSSTATGTVSTTVQVPFGLTGNYIITVTDASSRSADASFFKLSPSIFLTQTSGPSGTAVSIEGLNFLSSHKVTITDDGDPLDTIPPAKSDSSGAFVVSFIVPDSDPGDIAITASDGTNHAHVIFTITS